MRRPVDGERLAAVVRRLGLSGARGRVYVAGGATAVWLGFRESTIDVDLVIEGDEDAVLRAMPAIKEELEVNIELAAPHHFLPEVPGWRERSRWFAREGELEFYHYDLVAQALAKIERGHAQDRADVGEMLRRGVVDAGAVWRALRAVAPGLHRFPAVDPAALARAVATAVGPEPPDAAGPDARSAGPAE